MAASKDLTKILLILETILLGMILVFSPNTYQWTIWSVEQPNVFEGFRTASLSLFDLPLLALLGVIIARLFLDVDFRHTLMVIIQKVTDFHHGGLWWVLLVMWMSVNVFFAQEPSLARFGVIHTTIMIVMALLIAEITYKGVASPLFLIFSLSALFQAILAIAQVLNNDAVGIGSLGELRWDRNNLYGLGETTFRGYGLTAHPNILAGYLLVGLFAQTTLIYQFLERGWWKRLFYGTFLITIVGLLLTLSRTALLAGGIATLVVFLHTVRGFSHIPLKTGIPVLIVFILMAILAGIVFGDQFIERNQGLKDREGVLNRIFYEFPNTVDVIKTSPILGVGENNLMVEIGREKADALDQNFLLPAHNAYLVILAELGVIGLLLFLLAYGTLFIQLLHSHNGPLFIWATCALALSVVMFFDYYPWLDYRSRVVLFWIIGIWWGYSLLGENHRPNAGENLR